MSYILNICERLEQSVAQVRADRCEAACAGRRRIANDLSVLLLHVDMGVSIPFKTDNIRDRCHC